MELFISLIILLGLLLGLQIYRSPWFLTALTLAAYVLVNLYLGIYSLVISLIFIAIMLASIAIFSVDKIRVNIFTSKLAKVVKGNMAPISETEKIALISGDSWLEKQIFCGQLDIKKLHDLKLTTLTEEEQSFLDNETEQLCAMIDDWKVISQDYDLDKKTWKFIKDKGFFGLVIAKEYGGKQFSAAAHSEIVKKIASKSMTAAITVMVPNSLGPAELITHYGTKQQQQDLLPKLASGEEIPCFGLTGPYAGSDATAMQDYGVVCKIKFAGKEVIGIKLNFSKRYITLAPIATLIGIAFKLHDPENLLSQNSNPGITLCMIPRNHKGLEIGNRHLPLGIPFMNGTVVGKDICIPLDWIIGGKEMAGHGWKMLVECLAIGRAISLPAVADAYSTLAAVTSTSYSALRQQFGTSIVNFEGVNEKIAQMIGLSYICSASRKLTLTAVDNNLKPAVASAIVKYHLTEMTRTILNCAMDVHGGKTIISGPKNYLASAYQGLPICITVEGANILTRNLIIFGQGAIRSHPYVYDEMLSLPNIESKDELAKFDKTLIKHIAYFAHNIAKMILNSITAGIFIKAPTSTYSKQYKQLQRMSIAYAAIADFALINLGSKLKRKEKLSARLGDVLSYLYMTAAVLKQAHDNKESKDQHETVIWALDYCLFKAQESFYDFCNNYPNKTIGKIIISIAFPWGRACKMAPDNVEKAMVKKFLQNSDFRKSMSQSIYTGNDSSYSVCELEQAFQLIEKIDPILSKINNAVKQKILSKSNNLKKQALTALEKNIVSSEEYDEIILFETMRDKVIAVDVFNKNFTKVVGSL